MTLPPVLRRLRSAIYWRLQAIRHARGGTALDERRFRERAAPDAGEVESALRHPHRAWLLDRMLEDWPSNGAPERALEIGTGAGMNLEALAARLPALAANGIDIGSAAIEAGRRRLQQAGLDGRVTLAVGQADDLAAFADGSHDLVFTDAVLLYVGPDKIEQAIRETLRVARTRVALLEMDDPHAPAAGRYTRDGWVRDYRALLAHIAPDVQVSVERLPREVWDAGRWPEFGALIRIEMRADGTE